MNQSHKQQGFTLVELMLAMGFVSALLLAIAMTVIQIGNIYNTGITYQSVNQAGGALASQLQRDINSNPPFDLPGTNPVHRVTKSFGGRLCIGTYSYIWNYGKALYVNNPSQLNTYSGAESNIPINFVKVLDSTASYCANPTSLITSGDSVELLDVGQSNLAIHSFSIMPAAYDPITNQRMYNISFLIGTNDQTALTVISGSTACLTASDVNSDPTYCAINRFDIVARAGKKVAN